MAIQRINYGAAPDDGTGDPLRQAFKKTDDNFVDLDDRKAETTNVATALGNKVDKVPGKQLSTEDFTTVEKQKLDGIQPNATQNRPDSENASVTELANKVDKVAGSRLMTDAEGTKLAGVAAGATANRPDAELLARANHTGTQALSTVDGLLDALRGMRNKLINGAFQINQRGYVSGAATTANQYTLDRWKVSATSGITFTTANGRTTVTIPSGQTLSQIIEGANIPPGVYVLSWKGTAQGRIGAGAYGSSGAVSSTFTGGQNITVELRDGTVSEVQLEVGAAATPFEDRLYGIEELLCLRYCEVGREPFLFMNGVSSTIAYGEIRFKAFKRAAPTMATTVPWTYFSGGATTPCIVAYTAQTTDRAGFIVTGATAWNGWEGSGSWIATAEL